ncbi:Phage minor capsid protein 2 [Hathewaya proteolytica DSM 3090]|uniref:Phage minor capsid protein 2 n=1 Tax=Hathewaya proteolytica DSM 3090 TaxID=1121331 RepID=A0A1M6S135_9CLOT|nr:phage minor capsid protein [Hathewaya proteolytica]SHK38277.1 Phage minor capsid protein 2 [Hathewaya proteolytica DSM 3090]
MKKDYDVAEAFGAIEKELIDSMLRNYKRHRNWENKEGFDWTMWQVEQLKSLQEYKKRNKKAFKHRFSEINEEIEEMIEKSYIAGNMEAEIEILEAIKNGFRPRIRPKVTDLITEGKFFKINDRKLNALIKATKQDMAKAEVAMLRKANDEYRKTIFNAQVYANTGSGTYEQCVDMATKDFLSKGINCIEYKNGARVNIADYAAMAIQTANKRAYLQGEGAKRQEWGISTVITISRGGGCPKCVPFQGKIFIDDVWSGGTSKDGPYPLLSSAMAAGFYHPNCKDSHTTYFEGISTPPKTTTKEQQQKSIDIFNREQRENYINRQIKKYDRLSSYSLDKDNIERYKYKKQQWQSIRNIKTWRGATPVKTIYNNKKEIIKHMRDKYSLDFSDSRKYPIDKDLLQDSVNWMDKFNNYFKGFQEINPVKLPILKVKANMNAVGKYSYYANRPGACELTLNGAFFSDKEYNKKYIEKCIEKKWTVPNAKEYKTFVHEYGHNVADGLKWLDGGNTNWCEEFVSEVIGDYNKKYSTEYTFKDMATLVGEYAGTKHAELFAETFAEYFGGDNPREFAKLFGEKLDKKIKYHIKEGNKVGARKT